MKNQSIDSVKIIVKSDKCRKKIFNFLKKCLKAFSILREWNYSRVCDAKAVLVISRFQCITRVRIRDSTEIFQVFKDGHRQDVNFICNYDLEIDFVHFCNITFNKIIFNRI